MITIKFLGASRDPHLVRPIGDAGWLATPIGAAGCAGSGPCNKTCGDCAHLNLVNLVLSDHGRSALCLERQRLDHSKGKGGGKVQPVPLRTAACSQFEERTDGRTAFAFADERLAEQLVEKRSKIDTWRAAIQRTESEIRELQAMRSDPGYDAEWANAEPAPYDTS